MAGMPGIVIKVGVDAANAVRNLDKVGKALNRQASRADKARHAWKKTAAGIAAASAVFAAVAAESINAAMDEEQQIGQLDATLRGLGFEQASAGVQAWADNLQYAANVADTDIRNAFETIVRSSKDVAEAQDAVQLALDISAQTGKPLAAVAAALAKAYAGNTANLGKMNLGLDQAWLKTADMTDISQALTDQFGGSSEAQAGTLSGSVAGVKIATDELSESFGTGLVKGMAGADGSLEDTEDKLRKMQGTAESLGETIGGAADLGMAAFANLRESVINASYSAVQGMNILYDGYVNLADMLGIMSDEDAQHERDTQAAIKSAQEQAYFESLLGYEFGSAGDAAAAAATQIDTHTTAVLNNTAAVIEATAANSAWLEVMNQQVPTAPHMKGNKMTGGSNPYGARLGAQKKKAYRVNSVNINNMITDAARRASKRTGSKSWAATVSASQRSCS